MNYSLVSIITPSYNSEEFIAETIDAIKKQTYTNWELLISDDCSVDGTVDVINKYSKEDCRIKLYRLDRNSGAAIARNNSIKKANGRFIAFCDSDDVWTPTKLEEQVRFMLQKEIAFSYGAYQKMTEAGEKGGVFHPPKRLTFRKLLKTCSVGCLTAIYDVEKLGKMYMPKMHTSEDYGLWLEIHKKIPYSEGLVNTPLAYYRIHDNSISRNKFKTAKYHFEILKKNGDLNTIQAIYYFIHYTVNGLIKYLK